MSDMSQWLSNGYEIPSEKKSLMAAHKGSQADLSDPVKAGRLQWVLGSVSICLGAEEQVSIHS